MPRCQNCGYILILREKIRKYKCAKCGRLFSQKETELRDFRQHNEKQREIDTQDLRKKVPKEKEVAQRPPEEKREYDRNYYEKNKEKILIQKKLCRLRNKDKNNLTRREYRHLDPNMTQTNSRIEYWRNRQKELFNEQVIGGQTSFFDDFVE